VTLGFEATVLIAGAFPGSVAIVARLIGRLVAAVVAGPISALLAEATLILGFKATVLITWTVFGLVPGSVVLLSIRHNVSFSNLWQTVPLGEQGRRDNVTQKMPFFGNNPAFFASLAAQ
jgi:hypothetical protein